GSTANVRAGAAQGSGASPVLLLPQTLTLPVLASTTSVTAHVSGSAKLDAVLVQPVVSHLALTGSSSLDVYVNATKLPVPQRLSTSAPATVVRYDSSGRQVGGAQTVGARGLIAVEPGGFTTVVPR
ncbi:hypothetical protein N136_02580, partial [Leifsonia aquatica ATCC 14665]